MQERECVLRKIALFVFFVGLRWEETRMAIINKVALATVIIGALNWGSIGLFGFDIVAWICGGAGTVLARIIYTVVALAGLWCIALLFMDNEEPAHHRV